MRAPFFQMSDTEPGKHGLDPRFCLRLADTESLEAKGDIVAYDRQDDLVLRILEDETDCLQYRSRIFDGVETVHRHLAARRLCQTIDQPRKGGLARAVEADHADTPFSQCQGHGL
ncbi:hypothetical protein D3C80_1797610 [compost metagenome]